MTQSRRLADHAERALGHVIGGVRGVYDRHDYLDEKRKAFEALAGHIERILNPQPNVVPIAARLGHVVLAHDPSVTTRGTQEENYQNVAKRN